MNPCDPDPDDPGPDLVDLLRRSIALAKGERHLNAVPDEREEAIERMRVWFIPDEDGGYLYKQRISRTMAERCFDAAIAPLLAEVERRGAETALREVYSLRRGPDQSVPAQWILARADRIAHPNKESS
jgi:hypothetical protein